MIKRIFILALALIMTTAIICSCGSEDETAVSDTTVESTAGTSETEKQTEKETETETETETEEIIVDNNYSKEY